MCPDYLKHLNAAKIPLTFFYSSWLTIHFIVYLLILALFPAHPRWLNPFPAIVLVFVIQLVIIGLGWNVMPLYFKTGLFLWKVLLLLPAILLFHPDWSLPTLVANLAIGLVYLAYMRFYTQPGIYAWDIYRCMISNPGYYPSTMDEFLQMRK